MAVMIPQRERSRGEPGPEAVAPPAYRVSARAVIIGALGVALISLISPYLLLVVETWDNLTWGSLMEGPVVLLFLLVAVNGALLRFRPSRAFSRAELLIVYLMMMVSVAFVTYGGLPFLVSIVTYPFYMATPGNGYQDILWRYIPSWLQLPTAQGVSWMWEGLPHGISVPWSDWTKPGLAWAGFTIALLAAIFCLGALLSRGWIERQRLAFPLVDVPLAIAGEGALPSLRTGIFSSRVFWVGFALPALLSLLSWLHRAYPAVPEISLVRMPIGNAFSGMGLPWNVLSRMEFTVSPETIGIFCLVPTEVLLSLWLFFVLNQVALLFCGAIGLAPGAAWPASHDPIAFISYAETGAFIGLAGLLVWEARKPMRQLWAARTDGGRGGDEVGPYDPLSRRAALLGFVLANGFMLWFGLHAGMQWWALLLLVGLLYPGMLGASRMVAVGGVQNLSMGAPARHLAVRLLGAQAFTPATVVMYAYVSGVATYPANPAMPHMMDGFKLGHSARIRGRSLPLVYTVAIIVMLAVGIPAMLKVAYHYGAMNSSQRWVFTGVSAFVFSEAADTLRSPEQADGIMRVAVALGAVVMVGLTWLSTHALWWPVSPMGFLIAGDSMCNRWIWSNALIAWVLVITIRRYGGLRLYRAFRPVCFGLIVGAFLSDSFFALLDCASYLSRIHGG